MKKGSYHTEEAKKKMSYSMKGREAWNKGKTGVYSKGTLLKMSKTLKGRRISEEWRTKLSEAKKGSRHPNWKGGITPLNMKLRHSKEYVTWRKQIFERDNYTCLDCGKKGIYLEPHHILPIRKEEYRVRLFDLRNGITLCRECHQKTFRKEEGLAMTYYSLIPNQVY